MSAVATAWVWANSRQTGSGLLVLLAIADAANQDGENSYQSVATLSQMARISESTTHRALASLLEAGEIVSTGTHPQFNTKIYALSPSLKGGVRLTPPPDEGGVKNEAEGVSPVTPEPRPYPTTSANNPEEGTVGRAPRTTTIPPGWNPSSETVRTVRERFPRVDHKRSHERYVNHHRMRGTQAADWDAGFVNWVEADAQRQRDEDPHNGVAFDDITGLPVNPKPLVVVDRRDGS